MKTFAGFIQDVIGEDWEDLVTESIYENGEDLDPITLGLNARRWRQLVGHTRTLTEEKIAKIFGNGGKVRDAARELRKTDRRIRQIAKIFLARLAIQHRHGHDEVWIPIPKDRPLPSENQTEMTL